MLKVFIAVSGFGVWIGLLMLCWLTLGPDTFWQRLIAAFIMMVVAAFTGTVALAAGMTIFDSIDQQRK